MTAKVRKVMQVGVDLVREAERALSARHVADLALVSQTPAIHEASLVLSDYNIAPHPGNFDTVIKAVRDVIASVSNIDMRGDVSAIEAVSDPVSRAICTKQLEVIDRFYLIAAVSLGVEQGLRTVITTSAGALTNKIRDGPQPTTPPRSRLLRRSIEPPTRGHSSSSVGVAPVSTEHLGTAGASPIKKDTVDL